MIQDSGPGQQIRPASARNAHGLAVLLLALALAVGTALPGLGPGGPGFPAPSDGETAITPAQRGAGVSTRAGSPVSGSRTSSGGTPSKPLLVLPLNLNAADAEALQGLPGIGSTLAERIVAHREAHGPFQTAEDLLRVPGIGPKRWERIRPLVQVTEGP